MRRRHIHPVSRLLIPSTRDWHVLLNLSLCIPVQTISLLSRSDFAPIAACCIRKGEVVTTVCRGIVPVGYCRRISMSLFRKSSIDMPPVPTYSN